MDFKPGDIIVTEPARLFSLGTLVSIFTKPWGLRRRYCHVAIVAHYDGVLSVYESTDDEALGPCSHCGETGRRGVQVHPLDDWLKVLGQRKGTAWRFPLHKDVRRKLLGGTEPNPYLSSPPADWTKVGEACQKYLDRRYDVVGAMRARDIFLGRFFRWWNGTTNGSTLFCNEYVGTTLLDMNIVHTFNPAAYNPKSFARYLLCNGITHQPEKI